MGCEHLQKYGLQGASDGWKIPFHPLYENSKGFKLPPWLWIPCTEVDTHMRLVVIPPHSPAGADLAPRLLGNDSWISWERVSVDTDLCGKLQYILFSEYHSLGTVAPPPLPSPPPTLPLIVSISPPTSPPTLRLPPKNDVSHVSLTLLVFAVLALQRRRNLTLSSSRGPYVP